MFRVHRSDTLFSLQRMQSGKWVSVPVFDPYVEHRITPPLVDGEFRVISSQLARDLIDQALEYTLVETASISLTRRQLIDAWRQARLTSPLRRVA